MNQINPISYANLIKYSLIVNECSDQTLLFNFVGTQFNVYPGKPIAFIYYNITYVGKYYQLFIDGGYKNVLLFDDNSNPLPVIPTETIIDIYDTFRIDNENELPTIQDIYNVFGTGGSSPIITSANGILEKVLDGTTGLVKSLDRAKLNNIKLSVTENETVQYNPETISQLFQIKISEKLESYKIKLTGNDVPTIEFNFNIHWNELTEKVEFEGYFISVDSGCKLMFDYNTYFDGETLERYVMIKLINIGVVPIEYQLTYETCNIFNHSSPLGIFQDSEVMFIGTEYELILQSNTLSFNSNHIKYPEINWMADEW